MLADPLSDVLSLLDARSVVTNGLQAGGDWAFRCPAPDGLKFLAVVQGRAVLYSDETDTIHLEEGDVLLLNGSLPYVIASDHDVAPVCASTIFEDAVDGIGRFGDRPDLTMLGGRVALDRQRGELLLDVLPPLIHLPRRFEDAKSARWMIDRLSKETNDARPGSGLASSQLAQLIVVEVLRAHLEQGGAAVRGWLRGLADPKISLALSLMHGQPARAWRLEELAQALAMSRTAFAVRFRSVVGMTPLGYLSRWRMHLAERRLVAGGEAIGAVGRSLGYASEAAFSTAFKRERGAAPRAFLRDRI
jgi:AraC-like DNA-binding protein